VLLATYNARLDDFVVVKLPNVESDLALPVYAAKISFTTLQSIVFLPTSMRVPRCEPSVLGKCDRHCMYIPKLLGGVVVV
jgi:hypothetical protein